MLGLAAIAAGIPGAAWAQLDMSPMQGVMIRNTFGEIGLLDMPSGHMAPDGQIAFTVGATGATRRYAFAFQALPWMEATFRYSSVVGLFPAETHFHDRSFAAKIRLIRETDLWPDVSVGIRDMMGTGIYGSEYVAASKHIGPFDVTGGLGWGQLADRDIGPNPLGLVMNRFKTRDANDFGQGGVPSWKTYFTGRVGAFGGLTWQTPIDGLSLMAEYSSIRYRDYNWPNAINVRSPFNFGVAYRPWDFMAVSLGWLYGSTYGFTVTLNGDPVTTYPNAIRLGPKPPPPVLRTQTEQQGALSVLSERGRQTRVAKSGGPWVKVPTPAERAKQNLLQAYMSQARGVRDIEVNADSLVIDAHIGDAPDKQCATYAQIASVSETPKSTIAMIDLEDPNGAVTFCPVSGGTMMAANFVNSPANLLGEATANEAAIKATLKAQMEGQSLKLDALSIGTSELWVYYENHRYNKESEAAGRVVRLLMALAPPSVEVFHLVATRFGVPLQEITVTRAGFERVLADNRSTSGLNGVVSVDSAPVRNPVLYQASGELYPDFTWSIDPKVTQHLFDPDDPLQVMVYADAIGLVHLAPGLLFGVEVSGTVISNYTFTRPAGSNLPHVRTDLLKYLDKGKYGIGGMQLVYETKLTRDVVAQVRGGILEDMYTGVGGQILWRPEGSRFMFGGDFYQVWKRDFNRLFGIQDYQVWTGHASIYYASPWHGINFAVHAGRYLAGDYGATFEVTRRFSTGIEIGAWATFTDVPFAQFGEGSFDKGIMIRIPLEWGLPIFSQSEYKLNLASLTRDGGQRLAGDNSLVDEMHRQSYGEITESLDAMVEP